MKTLTGQSNDFIVIGTVQASEDDLSELQKFMGDTVTAEEVAIVEAVAFDDSKNANGWRVEDVDAIECLGASLNCDHSSAQRDSFGVVFAARTEECNSRKKKIVKAAIPKTAKNADIITDLRFKVARKTSPQIEVNEWADEKQQIVKAGRMTHLSLVQRPAFGPGNEILSLAASDDSDKAFLDLGRKTHEENVRTACRLAERKTGGFTPQQRQEAQSKYQSMNPMLLAGEVLPMLRELTADRTGTQKTLSAVTSHSTEKKVPAKSLYPTIANIFGEDKHGTQSN